MIQGIQMSKLTKLSTLALVAALAFGCSEQTAPTASDETPPQPQFNFTNNPDAGPIIVRGQTTFAVFWVDPKREISAIVGADIVEFCSGVFDFDLLDLQDHFPPGDATRIMQVLHGDDIRASAWDFVVFDCALYLSETPLASGLVDVRATDNDLNVFLDPENKNHNAFGFNVHGAFNGHSRCVWDGNDPATFNCTAVIIVR
jgi:hypothetical protein